MIRLFTCLINFGVDSNKIIDALCPGLYGQEDWRDCGLMPQIEYKAAAVVTAAASSSATASVLHRQMHRNIHHAKGLIFRVLLLTRI